MAVVFIESPYSGDIDRNIRYLALCCFDAGLRDECPYASHGLMTQHPRAKNIFVSDYDEKWNVLTREKAINISQKMRIRCDKTVFYVDFGWSSGMKQAKEFCENNSLPYEVCKLNISALVNNSSFCSQEFCDAIITQKPYSHFLQ